MKSRKKRFSKQVISSALALSVLTPGIVSYAENGQNAAVQGTGLIINEVYGGGGKAGKDNTPPYAPYMYDFIEMYNPTNQDISLKGLSLTYTNNSGGTVQTYEFKEGQMIKANDYFLLRGEATLGNEGDKGHGAVFNADAFFDTPEMGIGMSDAKGNVQLINGETVIDAVAYGDPETNKGEGVSITGIDYLTAVQRNNYVDTNNNQSDFKVVAPSPTMSGAKEGEVALLEFNKVAELKSDKRLIGQTVSIESTVTAADLKTKEDAMPLGYVQDSSAGIAVENLTNVKVGQKISVTGILKEVNGEKRIESKEVNILNDMEVPVSVQTLTTAQALTLDGLLSNITGVITAKTDHTITLNNELAVYIDPAILLTKELTIGQNVTVKGIVAVVDNAHRLVVRNDQDITVQTNGIEDTIDVSKIAGYDTGLTDEDGGVAEIVKYNTDNSKFYLVNGKAQTIDIVSLSDLTSNEGQTLSKEKSINIADAVNSDQFTYGDLTSIHINTKKKVIVVAVQEKDYTKKGKIAVLNYDGEILRTFDTGVQPDMIKMSQDGRFILTADEGEPRNGLADGVDPEGSVTIVDDETGLVKHVKFDDSSVIEDDVHIRNKAGKDYAVKDLEPEYIALSDDGEKAYVTLQENNAIATIDVKNGAVSSVKSLGYKDHSKQGNELDAARDGQINITNLPILGAYMPDSISQVTINGESYLITANEGDATEWEEFENIAEFGDVKDSIEINSDLFKGMSIPEAQEKLNEMKANSAYNKLEVLTDMGSDAVYTLGGRSFSMWKADTMELVFDSGSDFETITSQRLPEVFNWSNDDNVMDKRSAKKGPEPEDVKVGKMGDKTYAFIGLERIGGVMTYDISNPEKPQFVNYENTRDFTQKVAGDVAPEGLEFIAAESSPTHQALLLGANEVSGTVAVYKLGEETVENPHPSELEVSKTYTLNQFTTDTLVIKTPYSLVDLDSTSVIRTGILVKTSATLKGAGLQNTTVTIQPTEKEAIIDFKGAEVKEVVIASSNIKEIRGAENVKGWTITDGVDVSEIKIYKSNGEKISIGN